MALRLPDRPIDDVIVSSHKTLSRVRVLLRGEDTGTLLPVSDGTLNVDESNPIRRTISGMSVAGLNEWVPKVSTDPLNPASGVELIPEMAVIGDDEKENWYPLGVFRPNVPSIEDDGRLSINVDCVDRSDAVSRSLMLARVVFSGGADVGLAIRTILQQQAPWLPLDIPDAGYRLPSTTVVGMKVGADPWEECRNLARTIAHDLRVDVDGFARLVPITDPLVSEIAVTWEEDRGLTKFKRDWSADDLINGITVVWGSGWVVTVWDENSPYGINSPIGKRPALYSGDATTITSESQAISAATSELLIRQGLQQQTTCSVITDPRRDAGEAAQVKRGRLGVDEVLRITALTIPLFGAEMDVNFGSRRILT